MQSSSATRRPGPSDGGYPWSRQWRGTLVHAFLAVVLRLGIRAAAPDRVRRLALDFEPIADLAPTYRRLLSGELRQAAGIYLRHFAPPPDWRLLGAEMPLHAFKADLVWLAADGTVWIDEIKSGPSPRSRETQILTRATAYAQAGRFLYGDSFGGVRVCLLAAPSSSRLIRPDGQVTALLRRAA